MQYQEFEIGRLRRARAAVAATEPREPVRREVKQYLLELAGWLESIHHDPRRHREVEEFWRTFQLFHWHLETGEPGGPPLASKSRRSRGGRKRPQKSACRRRRKRARQRRHRTWRP